ncbi:MAG: nucleoside triphosphate pyrophosphohydrolase [Bacteriovoracia bacterium]
MPPTQPSGLERARAVVAKLRGPDGCPWDRAQTHESLRRYLLEETYEVLEALDELATNPTTGSEKLKEELGDLLLQVLLQAEIAGETGRFDIDGLANDLAAKLVRRHPHVFGGEKLESAEEVVGAWEKTKQEEKPRESTLDGLPPGMPALQQSLKIIERVSKVGFQWPSLEGPLEKCREELEEFLSEVEKLGKPAKFGREEGAALDKKTKLRLESELGDLIFSLSNIAHFLHLNPEDALRSMLRRFEKRFRHVETRARVDGKKLADMPLDEMDIYWNEAKRLEKP